MKNSAFFCLYSTCVPVKGAKQSIICDLQRDNYIQIPTVLFYILTKFRKKTIVQIQSYFNNEHNDDIENYFNLLVKNEYGFYTENVDNFPPIKLDYYNYTTLSNAIVDFDEASTHDLKNIIPQLSELFCEALELRFFTNVNISFFSDLLLLVKDSTLRTIELTIPFSTDLKKETLLEIQTLNPRIKRLIVYSAPVNDVVEEQDIIIYFTTDKIDSEACCGLVSPWHFLSKLEFFTEAKKYNSCLNKKVGIDARGEIKNCPSMAKSYGNIKNVLISTVLNSEFKTIWNITKDQINICKDCEFRYICQDCRAYTQDPYNQFSKPLKCSYDPYQAK